MWSLVIHEDGQVMYMTMPYFVFMEGMVSCLMDVENTSHVWNSGFSIPFCHLVDKDEDGLCHMSLKRKA